MNQIEGLKKVAQSPLIDSDALTVEFGEIVALVGHAGSVKALYLTSSQGVRDPRWVCCGWPWLTRAPIGISSAAGLACFLQ